MAWLGHALSAPFVLDSGLGQEAACDDASRVVKALVSGSGVEVAVADAVPDPQPEEGSSHGQRPPRSQDDGPPREARLVTAALRAIDTQLHTAAQLLRPSGSADAWRSAGRRLRAVEAGQLGLAYATTTDTRTASAMLGVRDDLSAALLAALLMDEATAAGFETSAAILRRAVASALVSLAHLGTQPEPLQVSSLPSAGRSRPFVCPPGSRVGVDR